MDEFELKLIDILELILYLGSIVYIIGLSFQLFISMRHDKRVRFKQIILILITTITSMMATYFLWAIWRFEFDVMFGPILIPALIAEVFLVPIFLKVFKYKIKIR